MRALGEKLSRRRERERERGVHALNRADAEREREREVCARAGRAGPRARAVPVILRNYVWVLF